MPGKGRPPQAIPSPISRHIITCYVRYQGSKHTVIYILVQTIISVQAKLEVVRRKHIVHGNVTWFVFPWFCCLRYIILDRFMAYIYPIFHDDIMTWKHLTNYHSSSTTTTSALLAPLQKIANTELWWYLLCQLELNKPSCSNVLMFDKKNIVYFNFPFAC